MHSIERAVYYWLCKANSDSYCLRKQSPTGKKSQQRSWYSFHTKVSWPVNSVSSLLIKCIRKNLNFSVKTFLGDILSYRTRIESIYGYVSRLFLILYALIELSVETFTKIIKTLDLQIIGKIVLLHCMRFETMWYLIKVFFAKGTNETFWFHVILDLFLLITQLAKSVND